jgi:hypothetical protein
MKHVVMFVVIAAVCGGIAVANYQLFKLAATSACSKP